MTERLKTYAAIDLEPRRSLAGGEAPLHVTITPPYEMDQMDFRIFMHFMRERVTGSGLVELIGEDEAMFGPNSEPMRVRKMARTAELLHLHELAMGATQEAGIELDTSFTGERFSPHATDKSPHRRFKLGQHALVGELTILRKKLDSGWTRAATIPLAPPSEYDGK